MKTVNNTLTFPKAITFRRLVFEGWHRALFLLRMFALCDSVMLLFLFFFRVDLRLVVYQHFLIETIL